MDAGASLVAALAALWPAVMHRWLTVSVNARVDTLERLLLDDGVDASSHGIECAKVELL